MDEERVFSLSYEQLTRIAEKNIRECGLDNQSARCISELKASALLWLWYEPRQPGGCKSGCGRI